MRNGSRGGAYTPVSAYDSDEESRDPVQAQRVSAMLSIAMKCNEMLQLSAFLTHVLHQWVVGLMCDCALQQKLRRQDEDLAVLSQSITRLGDLSLEIGKEIESQNR